MTYLRREIAKVAGIHPETIRYYESYGLIPKPDRTENGYRQYSESTLELLQFIQYGKTAGLSLSEIQYVFSIAKEENVEQMVVMKDFINAKIKGINQKIKELETVKNTLAEISENLHQPQDCPLFKHFSKDKK